MDPVSGGTRAERWARIEDELTALLAEDGLELVELLVASGRQRSITVSVDHLAAPGTITIEECAAASRRISRYLERVDPFEGAYRLMVSSPGVDRPLARLEQVLRAVGRTVRVTYRLEGRRATVTGRLEAVDGEVLRVAADGQELLVAWPTVQKANVVYDWDEA